MKTKFILAGIAGGLVSFFLGWLVYGILLWSYYEKNITHYDGLTKEMPVMWMLILSNLVSGFFIAFLFEYWARIRTWGKGFLGGLIVGLFWVTAYDFSFMLMYNLYGYKVLIVDILVAGLFYGVIGAIEGLILGT